MPLSPEKFLIPTQSAPQIVEIVWIDAHSNSCQWEINEEMTAGVELRIVGYIVMQTKNYITLAMEILKGGGYRSLFTIPMGLVVKMRRLK